MSPLCQSPPGTPERWSMAPHCHRRGNSLLWTSRSPRTSWLTGRPHRNECLVSCGGKEKMKVTYDAKFTHKNACWVSCPLFQMKTPEHLQGMTLPIVTQTQESNILFDTNLPGWDKDLRDTSIVYKCRNAIFSSSPVFITAVYRTTRKEMRRLT